MVDFLSDKDVRTATAATKSKHDPAQVSQRGKGSGLPVAHTAKAHLMADTNAWNAASFQTPSKRQMPIISAPMNDNQPKHTCIHPLNVPQNTKANPAIEK